MNERIKELRKALGLTQQDFADKIGIKRNSYANYETGRNTPLDAIIVSICREFSVNEAWLRTGEGEMFQPLSRDEELAQFFGKLSFGNDDFKHRLISVLSRLDENEWGLLEKMATGLVDEMKKADQ